MSKNRSILRFLPLLFLLALALSACSSDSSPAFGRNYIGKTLTVRIVTLKRMPELLYQLVDPQQGVRHFGIEPSSEDNELVLLRVAVANHTATSAVVNIDTQSAELRGLDKITGDRVSFRPIHFKEAEVEVSSPENPGKEFVLSCPLNDNPEDGRPRMCFLWNETLEDDTTKAFDLRRDYGLEGWMIFEAPKGTKFTELRWRAGDSLTIDF